MTEPALMQKLQRARIRGICCVADGEIRPFDCQLATILKSVEAAAVVGLRLRLDEDHVKVLEEFLTQRREGAETQRPMTVAEAYAAPANGS